MPQAVVVEQRVAADPADVFGAWTDPALFARWWWPHIPDTRYEIDARPEGSYHIESQRAGIGVRGRFVDVDPPHRLAVIWIWLDQGHGVLEETVTIEFVPVDGGTLVRVSHLLDDVDGHADQIRLGWEQVLARLAGAQLA